MRVAEADYQRLLAGSSAEEIKIAQTDVYNAKVNLDNAKQNLEDVKEDAQEDLGQVYENALNTLDDAYLKSYNAQIVVEDVRRAYFSSFDQNSIRVKENETIIENSLNRINSAVNSAKSAGNENIEAALLTMKNELAVMKEALESIREVTKAIEYRDVVSSADKTSLDNQKSYIISVRSDIISDSQTIITTKITNQTNINAAEATVASNEAALLKAEDQLELKKAGPIQENIDLYLAKITQAQAKVSLLKNKIAESTLKAPLEGQIIGINKKKGEIIQPSEHIFSFLPAGDFQVEADIYEEDIIHIKEGNPVKINLPAFPEEELMGKVASIGPAEKLIDGVVYYEVNIIFEETKEGLPAGRQGIKPGMTADIIILADKKENVLVIPKGAAQLKDGIKIVQILHGDQVESREIQTGLEGDEYIEVISGLAEGEQVVIE